MAVPNVVWLYPVRFSATSYVVRVTISGVTENLTFPATGSLTVGRDYWITGDGQADGLESSSDIGKGDLIAMLQATLRTHTQGATATASFSTSTWKVTCATGSLQTMAILWAHGSTTLDDGIFGFSGSTSTATSVTGSVEATGPIVFGRALAADSRDRQPIVGGISSSLSGKVRVSRLSLPKKERDFEFAAIVQSNALREYETTATSVERGWVDALSLGYPFRHYDQASDIAGSTYSVYRLRDLEYPLQRNGTNIVWWDASFRARLEVA